jgi:preprotein translocase subunit SecY
VVGGIGNIGKIPELRKRILFSILMLGLYRIFIFIPVPGVNSKALAQFFGKNPTANATADPMDSSAPIGSNPDQPGSANTLFSIYDMFSGGALEQFSVVTLGIMPYISASIILQLLTVVVPYLENLSREGEQGRRKITQYTRYFTIVLAIVQGTMIAIGLTRMGAIGSAGKIVPDGGWQFIVLAVITLSAGTALIMWMGEQITERGIGNGISLIIFAGIVARMPEAAYGEWVLYRLGQASEFKLIGMAVLMVAVIAGIIFCERGQRRIPVQYAKRVVGRKMYGAQSSHLPLKINMAGVIPPIFASSIIMFPATVLTFWQTPVLQEIAATLQPGGWLYSTLFVVLIVFFTFFYTAVTFNPVDVADNMKKYGGFIPGIRAGKKTAEYIDRVLTRITVGGSFYLAAICVLPTIMSGYFNVPFYFGGTSLLIVVGVAIDTVGQIESFLLQRHYDGLLGPRAARIRGRGRVGR